jgi:transcriptional regulator of arginine metabolism
MSKLSRHAAIRQIVSRQAIGNQDDLRRALYGQGHRVTQATLSRDIHELGLLKTPTGYAFPHPADSHEHSPLPSVERLIREFVHEVRPAQNMVVVKTSPGSAQPVAVAIDAEVWPEIVGTVGGDDTILIVTPDRKAAARLVTRIRGLFA